MKKLSRRFLFAACLVALGLPAQAAPVAEQAYAIVDSVQMPAWVERNGVRQPLEPGKVLHNRDRVLTGSDARLLIQLAEGSAVKLGENAQLELNALGRREGRVFTAVLDVTKGAFRFTTGVFSKLQQQRAVNVRIATITAGIRGTDLWGSANAERDLVCLLEGRITVFHPQDQGRELSEALSFYVAPKGAAPLAIAKVDAVQVGQWAAQTEMQLGSGYARRGGLWKVELATVASEIDTLALYDRARAAGYAVRIKPLTAEGGGYRYSVRVTQLPSKAEAEILSSKLAGTLELASTMVTRY
jgi:hypothetical protein